MTDKFKTIYLLRHGKSAWDQPDFQDIKRELLPKGIQRTQRIANYLKEINIKIDLVICSPAIRTISTAEIICSSLNLPKPVIHTNLYPCSSNEIYDSIISIDDSINNIMVVAHNPGISYFAQEYFSPNIEQFHTSGIASCRFYTNSWSEFALADKKLNFVVSPKKLK
jgi:phosphohistidine phosphatase